MNRYIYRISILSFITLVVIVISPFLGIRNFSFTEILSNREIHHIFFSIRIPRMLTAFVAGGGLAVAGMVYQALFRNPLASPYTLGISGGASLGAALAIVFGVGGSLWGFSFISIGSFMGALGVVLLIYIFAWSKENSSTTLILAGVIVATVCSGLIMFLHYISPLKHSFQIMRWIMGGVDGTNYMFFTIMATPVLVFLSITFTLMPQLDQFLTGDSLAHSRGVNVEQSRNIFIIVTAIAVGAIVSICGPIGFVGIMAPHVCRMLFTGIRHRGLALSSFMLGGTFLTLSDTFARIVAPPSEVPVGIITALFGGPFFLIILFKNKGNFNF